MNVWASPTWLVASGEIFMRASTQVLVPEVLAFQPEVPLVARVMDTPPTDQVALALTVPTPTVALFTVTVHTPEALVTPLAQLCAVLSVIPGAALLASGVGWLGHPVFAAVMMPITWLAQAGWETLVNRKGTTWRQLDAATQAAVKDTASARRQLLTTPSLIKRPVVVNTKRHQVVVGVNKYIESEESPLTGGVEAIMTVSEEAETNQIERDRKSVG